MAIDVRWADGPRRLDLRLAPGSKARLPVERRLRVRLAGGGDTREIRFAGAPTSIVVR